MARHQVHTAQPDTGSTLAAYLNYTYDAYGNVLRKQDSDLGACQGSCSLWNPGQTVWYAYNLTYDELSATYGKVAESFAYNGLGSLTSRSGWAYVYDFQEELVSAKSTSPAYTYSYAYDGTGRKVEEVDAMASTYTSYFAYVGSTLAYTDNATSGVKSSFVYLGNQLLFRIDSSSGTTAHFYGSDLSNNVRLVWSYTTSVVVELKQRYKPFGELATPLVTPSSDSRFKYAQQSYSSPTHLYAMGARSYAPDLGRFTSRDPVGGHGYAYAHENPLSFWDPSGRDELSVFRWVWSGLKTIYNDIVGAATAVYNNPFDPTGAYEGKGLASGPLCSGQCQASRWWTSQSPSTRQDLWIGAGLVVGTVLTAGLLDVFAAPTMGAVAGAGALLSGGLAAIGDWLGGAGDALGGLWDALTAGEGDAAAGSQYIDEGAIFVPGSTSFLPGADETMVFLPEGPWPSVLPQAAEPLTGNLSPAEALQSMDTFFDSIDLESSSPAVNPLETLSWHELARTLAEVGFETLFEEIAIRDLATWLSSPGGTLFGPGQQPSREVYIGASWP